MNGTDLHVLVARQKPEKLVLALDRVGLAAPHAVPRRPHAGKKQKRVKRHEAFAKGDQYTFVALAASSRAIVPYLTGKRDGSNTDDFVQDLRGHVLGSPEISTDGWDPYKLSVRDAFRNSAHGVIVKTLAVTDLRKDAAHRYSPCALGAVSREVVSGLPMDISTSYVERSNLSIRMASRRFTRLTNGPVSRSRPRRIGDGGCNREELTVKGGVFPSIVLKINPVVAL
jgi:IS1 family transposase